LNMVEKINMKSQPSAKQEAYQSTLIREKGI